MITRSPTSGPFSRGFTLIELLMVVGLIGLMISLLLPAVQQARESARRTQCQHNLQQIGVAFRTYQHTHTMIPSGSVNITGPILSEWTDGQDSYQVNPVLTFPEGQYRIGWIPQLLPALGQGAMWRQIDFNVPERSFRSAEELEQYDRNMKIWQDFAAGQKADNPDESERDRPDESEMSGFDTGMSGFGGVQEEYDPVSGPPMLLPLGGGSLQSLEVPGLRCPSDPVSGYSGISYAGAHHSHESPIDSNSNGLLYLNSSEALDTIPDGATNTILAGEKIAVAARDRWLFGDSGTLRNGGPFGSYQPSGNYPPGQQFTDSLLTEEQREERKREQQLMVGAFSSVHAYSVGFLMADGSVRYLSRDTSPEVIHRLVNRRDMLDQPPEF